jgi:phage-related protein
VRTAVSDAIGDVVRTVSGLKGRITGALGNVGSLLYNSGRSLISGFISGIKSMLSAAKDAASAVVGKVRGFFGNSPAKEGPLSGRGWTRYSGEDFSSDFAAGIRANQSLVTSAAGRLVSGAAAPVSAGQGVASLLSSTRTAQTVTAQAAAPNVSVNTAAPRVTVMIGNKVINDYVQILIDDNNAIVARQLAQGVRI